MDIMKIAFCWLCVSLLLLGQSHTFEVASVKPRDPKALITMVGGGPVGSRLNLEAMSLVDLISWAYDVKPTQVAGGPNWSGVQRDRTSIDESAKRFDVSAKADDTLPHSLEDFRQMLQTLLLERFKLAVRTESRETSVYALVVDKRDAKVIPSAPDAKGILRTSGKGRIIGSGATMLQLANWFSNANGVERPVVDETGLTGRYDFTLEWSNPLIDDQDSKAPAIFTAISEQLGLRLEPRKMPLTVLVIEHAELPGEN